MKERLKTFWEKGISVLLCAALLLGLFPSVPMLLQTASAATVSGLTDGNIGLTNLNGTWSASGTSITGNISYNTTSTLTITNNSSSNGVLTFDYELSLTSGYNDTSSATVNGVSYSISKDSWRLSQSQTWSNQSAEISLGAGASTTISIKTGNGKSVMGRGSGTITISNIKLVLEIPVTVTFMPAAKGGSYTVNGSTIESETLQSSTTTEGFSVAATPNPGYVFAGWTWTAADSSDGGTLSVDEITTLRPEVDCTITPVFISESLGQPFSVNETLYYTWETAIDAAVKSGSTVLLVEDYTLPTNMEDNGLGEAGGTYVKPDGNGGIEYILPAGVTLILPYSSSGKTALENEPEYPYLLGDWKGGNGTNTNALATSESYEYRKLTLPQNNTLYVRGTVATGGFISSIAGVSGGTNGSESETYSVLEINGILEVQSGGIVTSCGYIYGTGTLRAQSGAELYQPLVICDYRGGGYTTAAAGKSFAFGSSMNPSGESYISPFTRYTAQNIQTRLEMVEGALMYGYCDLFTSALGDAHNRTTTCLIGSNSVDGLIRLKTGSTLTSTYDKDDTVEPYPRVGHTDITITGGASFGYLTLTVKVVTEVSITTNELMFPVPYNYGIHLNGENAKYEIGYSMVLLPGATLEVGEGAILDVGNSSSDFRFMAMDGYNCHTTLDATRSYNNGIQLTSFNYPNTANLQAAGKSGTSDLIVSGTLNINSGVNFGGVVQASGNKAILNMNSGAEAKCKMQMGLVGSKKILGTTVTCAGATVRELPAQIVDRGTGQRIDIVPGEIYYGSEGGEVLPEYTYVLYTTAASTSTNETKTETLNAAIKGSWYNYKGTVVTMDTVNNEEKSSATAYFCVNSDMTGYYSNAACTAAATVPSSDGFTYYVPSAASVAKVIWADGSGEIYYLTLRDAVKDAVHKDDTVVLLTDIEELDSSVAIGSTQNITITLNGHSIAYSAAPFVNSGILALDLDGGSITNNVGGACAADAAFTNTADGTAVINLNGGSIEFGDPGTNTSSQAVLNYGTLTIKNTGTGGSVTSSAVSASSIASAGASEGYAAAVRNVGTHAVLTVENAALAQNQTTNNYSVGIVNHNGARIVSLTNASISCTNGYAVYNLGATIDQISGGIITGRWGIFNRNIRTGSNDATSALGNRYTVSRIGRIGSIKDATVTATYQYALWNGGIIDTLGGTAKFTVTTNDTNAQPGYAVYNSNSWYYDSYNYKNYYSSGTSTTTGERVYVQLYDLDNRPTIHTITDDVVIEVINASSSVDRGRALENCGVIDLINGNATITTYVSGGSASYSRYALYNNGGYIGEISGNAVIKAGDRAIQNTGDRTAQNVSTKEYWQETDSNNKTAWKSREINRVTTYADMATIEKITGNVQIIAEKNQYAILNCRHIGEISGNAIVRTEVSYIAICNYEDGGLRQRVYTRTYVSAQDTTVTQQYTRLQADTYNVATIDSIGPEGSDVLIQSKTSNGIQNRGLIKSIGPGATIWGTSNALKNGDASHYLTRTYVMGYYGATQVSNQEVSRTKGQPIIEKIDGATIQATSGQYGINNYGLIESIENSTVSATSTRGINNETALETGYEVTYSLIWDSDSSSYIYSWTDRTTTYTAPKIEAIGDGNTVAASGETIYNRGRIDAIGGAGVAPSTVTASSGAGIYNLLGVKVSKFENNVDGTATEDTSKAVYSAASIGTIKKINISGTTYGIKNGDGSSTYPVATIDELGEGLIATAKNADGYGVYNADANASITLISGGDFKGGAENLNRAYAIYNADGQTYEKGKVLSGAGVTRTVTFADGSKGSGYYYVADDIFSVTISWGELSYIYTPTVYTWNGALGKYETNAAGWALDTSSGADAGKITITNNSASKSITAALAFTPVSGMENLALALTGADGNSYTPSAIIPGGSQTVTAMLSGKPGTLNGTTPVTVGTLTVTIQKT